MRSRSSGGTAVERKDEKEVIHLYSFSVDRFQLFDLLRQFKILSDRPASLFPQLPPKIRLVYKFEQSFIQGRLIPFGNKEPIYTFFHCLRNTTMPGSDYW